MLRKILYKVFINKKFVQCIKTLRTLKIDVFKIPGNKNIGISFSNYELFYLDQANSSSDPSQILILRFFIPRGSLPYSRSLSNFTLANWNLHQFSYFLLLHSTTRTIRIGYTKPNDKPTQSNLLSSSIQIIIPYGSNRLPIKKLCL